MGPPSTWNMKMDTRGTQTDVVTDRHIADCLMELKSTAEFQDLTYRVSEHGNFFNLKKKDTTGWSVRYGCAREATPNLTYFLAVSRNLFSLEKKHYFWKSVSEK